MSPRLLIRPPDASPARLHDAARALWPLLHVPGASATFAMDLAGPSAVRPLNLTLGARFPSQHTLPIAIDAAPPTDTSHWDAVVGAPTGSLPHLKDDLDVAKFVGLRPLAPAQHNRLWPDASPGITVIVPTRSRPAPLRGLLDALSSQQSADFELILVSDGPPLDLNLDRLPMPAASLHQPPSGPAAARNLALRYARGTRCVFLNDDARPAADLIARHATLAHDDEITLGAFTLLPEHAQRPLGQLFDRTTLLFAQPLMTDGRRYAARTLCTGNVGVSTRAIQRVGGFDEWFTWAGGEDSDLGTRLGDNEGMATRFHASLACGHDHALTLDGFLARQHNMGRSTAWMARRHRDPSLLLGKDAPPPDLRFFQSLATQQPAHEARLDTLKLLIAAHNRRAAPAPALEGLLREAGAICFRAGIIDAWRRGEA